MIGDGHGLRGMVEGVTDTWRQRKAFAEGTQVTESKQTLGLCFVEIGRAHV